MQQGFSLIETLITIAIIAIALASILLALNFNIAHSGDPMIQTQEFDIASAYLSEIMSKAYHCNPTVPHPPSSRSRYQCVDDYQGLINHGATDQDGHPIQGLSQYTVTVAIDDGVTVNGILAKEVTVAVSHGSTRMHLSAYRFNTQP